jgi:hypothetical protein
LAPSRISARVAGTVGARRGPFSDPKVQACLKKEGVQVPDRPPQQQDSTPSDTTAS